MLLVLNHGRGLVTSTYNKPRASRNGIIKASTRESNKMRISMARVEPFLGDVVGTSFEIKYQPPLNSGAVFTWDGSRNYLACILASASVGRRREVNCCGRCQRSKDQNNGERTGGRFADCYRHFDDDGSYLFNGACLNCAWHAEYRQCSLSALYSSSGSSLGASSRSASPSNNALILFLLNSAVTSWALLFNTDYSSIIATDSIEA